MLLAVALSRFRESALSARRSCEVHVVPLVDLFFAEFVYPIFPQSCPAVPVYDDPFALGKRLRTTRGWRHSSRCPESLTLACRRRVFALGELLECRKS